MDPPNLVTVRVSIELWTLAVAVTYATLPSCVHAEGCSSRICLGTTFGAEWWAKLLQHSKFSPFVPFLCFFFFFVPSSLVPSRERKLFDVHVNNGYQGKTSVAGARPGWARVGLKGLAGIGA